MAALSAKLEGLLLDDCHVRYAVRLLHGLNADLALRAKEVAESVSSRTRFLPTIGRREELAAIEAVDDERERASAAEEAVERLQALVLPALGHELESHVRAVAPAYVRGLTALHHLVEWPEVLSRLEVKLAGFIRALGQARNMATTGYDRQQRAFAPAAREAVDLAIAAARTLDEEVARVNGLADQHQVAVLNTPQAAAVLPRVPVVHFRVRLERVQGLEIAEVQAEFGRILEMCATLEETGLVGLREATTRVATQHGELSRKYLETYLGQLRVYMDTHRLVSAETTGRIQRLQLQYLGVVNFPFELG
jgi:hypothetical protein